MRIGKKPFYIFVTGGIVSGIGKGITAATISLLLKNRGFEVAPLKIDPYLNRDAGTMNPYQHGEVFVTEDGSETDLDLGHYERFTEINLTKDSNFTTGAVYESVMHHERHGDFLGQTIQIIPHITDEIRRRIIHAGKSKKADVVVVEIGGTVGDIEAEPFLESVRQILCEYGRERVVFVHTVKMDYIFPSDEAKTKPIQQSVKLLQERGIQPDFLVVRCKRPLIEENIKKIALFSNLNERFIVEAMDARTIYHVPVSFYESRFDHFLLKRLNLPERKSAMGAWLRQARKLENAKKRITIALVGKYVDHDDAYISVEEAIHHASYALGVEPHIVRINAEHDYISKKLKGVQALVIPGGFGKRGIEGKIKAIQYAREHRIPFLGLCLGLQTAVVEFARHVCKLNRANSSEFDPKTPHPVIDLLPDQKNVKDLGGTMRLGSYGVRLKSGTLVHSLYGRERVSERHRHRYEVNPKYHEHLEKKGMKLSGFATHDKRLVDFIELTNHPFFIATQAHPEFKSRFLNPHPLFVGLARAALKAQ